MSALLQVEGLCVEFHRSEKTVEVVSDVSFDLTPGKTLGIVGESGCGKSATAMSIMQLHNRMTTRLKGRILYKGRDLLLARPCDLQAMRGNEIGMVFQDSMASLNPLMRVGDQIAEPLRIHKRCAVSEIRERTLALMRAVEIPSPEIRIDAYPHELSGGLRQRVMIAIALACGPDLLIADEPTTALDVTIQAQIVALLQRMTRTTGKGLILISHDLGLISEICDEILVMYAGRALERGPTRDILHAPSHPYTRALLECLPNRGKHGSLGEISGTVPDVAQLPPGCRFGDRCAYVRSECQTEEPSWGVTEGRFVRCHFPLRMAS